MISDFGVDFEAWLLVLLGFGAKTTEVSHLRSKIKKTSYRKSRKAFRKRSRKTSSERRTRENRGFRLSSTFSEQKPIAAWSRVLDRFRSLATRFWSQNEGRPIRNSILRKCISFDASQNLFSTWFSSCKTVQKQAPTWETQPVCRGENSKKRLQKLILRFSIILFHFQLENEVDRLRGWSV